MAVETKENIMSQSQLTDLPTIGEHTARLLAEHGFQSVADLAAATVEKISAVPGFGDARAVTVREAAVQLLQEAPVQEEEAKVKKEKDKKKDGKKKNKKKDKKDKKDKKGKKKDKKDKKKDKKGKKKDGKKKKK